MNQDEQTRAQPCYWEKDTVISCYIVMHFLFYFIFPFLPLPPNYCQCISNFVACTVDLTVFTCQKRHLMHSISKVLRVLGKEKRKESLHVCVTSFFLCFSNLYFLSLVIFTQHVLSMNKQQCSQHSSTTSLHHLPKHYHYGLNPFYSK